MRFRSLLAVCALPLAATATVYGCSGEPAPEDLCAWLHPGEANCVSEFHEDIKDKCGALDSATVTGTFATRTALDMCVLTSKGGQIVFDPPVDLVKFPPVIPTTMKIVNADGTSCGEVAYLNKFSWSLKIDPPVSLGSGGGSSTSTGTGGSDNEPHFTRGKISVSNPRDQTIQIVCPAPDVVPEGVVAVSETHNFNLNQVLASTAKNGCPEYEAIIPQAIFEIDPGGVQRAGALRLKIQYPPGAGAGSGAGGGSTTGAGGSTSTTGGTPATVAPEVVYYFDCAIPAADLVCANGAKDASEVDVDCGGPESTPTCPARCSIGQLCITDCDCDASTSCEIDVKGGGMKKCTLPTDGGVPAKGVCSGIICANEKQDSSESDIDCGGVCGPTCIDGKKCNKNGDCIGNSCTGGICKPSQCDDMVLNGAETDVDCGGACITKCDVGETCKDGSDCKVNGCFKNKCSTCADGVQDSDESDVDCGGATCDRCANGLVCKDATDCMAGISCLNNKCGSCSDGVKDGVETDVDCGGPNCGPCPEKKACNSSTDCLNKVCVLPPLPDSGIPDPGVCNTCLNGVPDANESDVDCGGTCAKCTVGGSCKVNVDCVSGICINKLCK